MDINLINLTKNLINIVWFIIISNKFKNQDIKMSEIYGDAFASDKK